MLRVDLDRQLKSLEQEVAVLAEIVEKAIHRAVDALKRRDLEASQQVIDEDDYIDQKFSMHGLLRVSACGRCHFHSHDSRRQVNHFWSRPTGAAPARAPMEPSSMSEARPPPSGSWSGSTAPGKSRA